MSNHAIPVVRITEILKHPNADQLGLVEVGGFQVVVRLEQFKVGDLAVYIPPDSIVPEIPQFSFVWERDGAGQPRNLVAGEPVPEKYRRVTVRKFRKEWSEGLLLPVTDFEQLKNLIYTDDLDVSEFLGITHWNPPEDQEEDREASIRQSKTRPRSLKGWFYFIKNWSVRILTLGYYDPWGNCGGSNEKAPRNTPPVYDVENFKHHKDVFVEGEYVVVTEKIHGSNARYLFAKNSLFETGHLYAGSRKLWKSPTSSNIWRDVLKGNPEIVRWLTDNPGYALYGEVVPTQAGFEYGHKKAEPWLYVFDILTPKGEWLSYTDARPMTGGYDIEWVPLLYHGPYNSETIEKLVDGPTKTGGFNIREGVVIKTNPERHARGLGRVQLKIVSNAYLLKEQ